MYSKEKIYEVLHDLCEGSKIIKPYVVIAQPRRDLNETPAQEFNDYQITHVDFCGYSRGFLNIGGEMVDVARNYLIETAIAESGAKYLLFVGEDTVLPYDAFTKLHKTAEENPDSMVVGVYYIKHSIPMIMVKTEDNYIIPANVDPGQIIDAWMTGLDAALIPIKLLKKMKDETPDLPFCVIANKVEDMPFIGEDNFFVHRWHKAGNRILVNTDVQCLHMDLASGKYTAHPSVNLKNYYTNIPVTEPLNINDKAETDKRWSDRLPNNSILEKIKELISDNPIKLNLGCGQQKLEGYVNIDKYDHHADLHMDIENIKLPENSVDEILGIHIFEHLNPHKVEGLVSDWYRILKSGSKLILEMPNIEELCKDFVTANEENRKLLNLCIYGSYDTFTEGKTINITSPHLWGWYPKTVTELLEKAGFKNIKILPQTTIHPGSNFRVEATKE